MERTEPHFRPDWVLLGDDSRYEFLFWLLPEDTGTLKWKDHHVWLRYGPTFQIEQQNEEWVITTPALPPLTTLYIPADEEEWSRQPAVRSVKCAIFEEHPFEKEDNRRLYYSLLSQNAETLTILMDLPYRHSSTDLSEPGEDLARAKQCCQKRGQTFRIARDASDTLRILHWRESFLNYWLHYLENILEKLHACIEAIQYDYEELLWDWTNEGGFLSAKSIKSLCSFYTVSVGSSASIWQCFTERALQIYFPKNKHGGLYPIADLYENCVCTECGLTFLPIENDKSFLMAQLQQAAIKAFQLACRPGDKPSPLSREMYQKMMADSEMIRAFNETFQNFVTKDTLPVLQNFLEQRYQQIKSLLK